MAPAPAMLGIQTFFSRREFSSFYALPKIALVSPCSLGLFWQLPTKHWEDSFVLVSFLARDLIIMQSAGKLKRLNTVHLQSQLLMTTLKTFKRGQSCRAVMSTAGTAPAFPAKRPTALLLWRFTETPYSKGCFLAPVKAILNCLTPKAALYTPLGGFPEIPPQ
jgi:hypothetical protein